MEKPSRLSDRTSSALAALAITITAAALFSPLLLSSHGIFLYPSDGHVHLFWAQQFIKGLSSGVLYPRWAMDLNGGCGSIAFIFYPPFTLYTYALAYLFTPDVASALVLSLFVATLASGGSMYAFSRLFLGRKAAVLSAVSYMAFPYHVLDLYHRSMFSEYWSFAWVPLIMLFIHRIGNGSRGEKGKAPFAALDFAGLSVCYLGLILTNLPVAMLVSIFIALHVGFCLWEERSARLFFIRTLALALGICLSAFYLLPALMEQKNANISHLTGLHYIIEEGFIFTEYTKDPVLMEFVNKAAIACLLALASPLLLSLRKTFIYLKTKDASLSLIHLYMAAAGLFSVFLMSSHSAFLWDSVAILRKAQYPYRLLVFTTFASCFLLGYVYHYANERLSEVGRWWAGYLLPTAILLAALGISVSIIKDYVDYYPPERVEAASRQGLTHEMSYDQLREAYTFYNPENAIMLLVIEFAPKWIAWESPFDPLVLPGFDEPAVFIGEKANINVIMWEPEKREFEIEPPTPGTVLLRTFYYPSWQATVDGKPAQLSPHPPTGLISLNVGQGRHTVRLWFERDGAFRAGKLISIAGLLVITGTALLLRKTGLKGG